MQLTPIVASGAVSCGREAIARCSPDLQMPKRRHPRANHRPHNEKTPARAIKRRIGGYLAVCENGRPAAASVSRMLRSTNHEAQVGVNCPGRRKFWRCAPIAALETGDHDASED